MQVLPKVLLVEDDSSIAGALAQALRSEYDIDVAATGKLALYKTDSDDYEIIVLDLHLPDISGINVCQQLRERGVNAPILILSGEAKVMTKISLLDAGANDYLTKPVSLGELKARLRAIHRFTPKTKALPRLLQVDDLIMDRQAQSVTRAGQPIYLRRKEFTLLECLMEHVGSVVTRDALNRYVWPGNNALWTNTVDVHVKHLRDKIDRPYGSRLIRTVHGLGYKIEAQPAIAGKR
jgi:DNA-binding response OmpR family regulator